MNSENTMQRNLAAYLLKNDRMIIEPTAEMMQLFPMQGSGDDVNAWLNAAADVLQDAVELRQPKLPGAQAKLVVKDRAGLFNYTQERTLEDMARDRKSNQYA